MPWEDGVASSPVDLLQKIVAFLQLHGWTVNMSQSEVSEYGGYSGWRAHVSKGDVYANMKAALGNHWYKIVKTYTDDDNAIQPGIGLNLSTGYDSSLKWFQQPGAIIKGDSFIACVGQLLPAANIPSYHCFLNNDDFICVIEASTGFFGYIGFGPSIDKVGGWSGGQYYFGSSHSYGMTHIYTGCGITYNAAAPFANGSAARGDSNLFMLLDIDTTTGYWLSNYDYDNGKCAQTTAKYLRCAIGGGSLSGSANAKAPYFVGDPNGEHFQSRQYTAYNAQNMLLPAHIFVDRDAGGVSYLGVGRNIVYTSATDHGVPANSVLTIGADKYRVYPNFAVRQVD